MLRPKDYGWIRDLEDGPAYRVKAGAEFASEETRVPKSPANRIIAAGLAYTVKDSKGVLVFLKN